MFALWMFGRTLEYDLGSRRFLIFYLLSGIGAGVLYNCVNWIQMHYFGMPAGATIGASGAIYGILLGFGMLHPNSIIMMIIPPIPMKAKYFVMVFMAIELFLGVKGGDGVAHFAHITGMVSAFILLKYWKARKVIN
jgi:membrane associated rhomboid family serine protease